VIWRLNLLRCIAPTHFSDDKLSLHKKAIQINTTANHGLKEENNRFNSRITLGVGSRVPTIAV